MGAKSAKVCDLKNVRRGRQTDVFRTSYQKGADSLCFSLVFANRTVDLQCISQAERDVFFQAFMWLLDKEEERRSGVSKPYNVKHVSHVNRNYEWDNNNLKKDFLVGRLLGAGSFGSVCLGFHRASGMQMAIKMIELEKNGERPEDIKAEIDVLKKCKHEGIVSFYGCAGPDSSNRLWILMELCRGGSLRDILDTFGPMTERQIQYICAKTLKALIYLHSHKVVHRDLKAANILLTNEGKVKITDFGISYSASGRATQKSFDESKRVVGSPFWMPPEVIEEKGASIRSDVWSLAVTLIELAEGVPPHAALKSIFGILRAIVKSPPPQLTEKGKWTNHFHGILKNMLQKDHNKRPTPRELLSHPFVSTGLYMSAGGSPSPLFDACKSRLRMQRKEKLKISQLPSSPKHKFQTKKSFVKEVERQKNLGGHTVKSINTQTNNFKSMAFTKREGKTVSSNPLHTTKNYGTVAFTKEKEGLGAGETMQTMEMNAVEMTLKAETVEINEYSEDSDDDIDYSTKTMNVEGSSLGVEMTCENVSFENESLAEQYEKKLKSNTMRLRRTASRTNSARANNHVAALERKKNNSLMVYGAGALGLW
eukprot:CAMPEP_0184495184 /NCGR_PEP_ID=MMETSP0113_2-20130426/30586_1 /TAXON_ID=91329 /ORGANISM="Norrisiella sphaerica, Strain BC52" /LENGTH=594 /DNA_ID=CAMNT_0026881255 /DNA_START=253 /DNA_END=2034 /DNA_ORIENTATION=+